MAAEKTMPKDLKNVHKKCDELEKEKGEKFAHGFLAYMMDVDYDKIPKDEALKGFICMMENHRDWGGIEEILSGREKNEYVEGFKYGESYSKKKQYTYKD